jgi:hypothetical protein
VLCKALPEGTAFVRPCEAKKPVVACAVFVARSAVLFLPRLASMYRERIALQVCWNGQQVLGVWGYSPNHMLFQELIACGARPLATINCGAFGLCAGRAPSTQPAPLAAWGYLPDKKLRKFKKVRESKNGAPAAVGVRGARLSARLGCAF